MDRRMKKKYHRELKTVVTLNLLGVTFDFKLTFNSHGKLTIYYSFILSNFNYCPLVWHFCGEGNTKKLEKIQERAIRFIYNDSDSSYENLLEKSQLPSLRLRRLRSMAIEAFKIINKQTPVYLHDLVTIKKIPIPFAYQVFKIIYSLTQVIWKFVPQFCCTISQGMQTIPGGVNSWYVDSVVVSKRVRTFLYSY
jgi:hypothetical protein